MSLFEKNIYVDRIIASKRAFGSVVRCKRKPLSCAADFFCACGNFQKDARGSSLRRGLKEATAINGTTQKQSTQGGNQALSARENWGLVSLLVLGTETFHSG